MIKEFVISLGILVIIILGITFLVIDLRKPEMVLDPVEVPEDIAKSGYTGIVISEQLADVSLKIQLETRKLSRQNSWFSAVKNLRSIGQAELIQDFTVPGVPFSVRTISRFIRQGMSLHDYHLRGDLININGKYVITLRNLSATKVPAIRIAEKQENMDLLVQEAGKKLLQLTNPLDVAINAYYKFLDSARTEQDFKQLLPYLEYCLDYQTDNANNAMALYVWGSALLDMSRPEEAILKYQKIIALDPTFAVSYYGWGDALRDLNRPTNAILQYRKAIELNPKFANAYLNWGLALLDLKHPEEAQEQFQQALKLDPELVNAYGNLGLALQYQGKYPEAISQYQQAEKKSQHQKIDLISAYQKVELDSNLASVYHNWGQALVKQNQFKEAIFKYKEAISQYQQVKALALNHKDPVELASDYVDLGIVQLMSGSSGEAVKSLQKAVELNTSLIDAYVYLGNIQQQLNNYKEAVINYTKAIKLNPKLLDVYYNLGYSLRKLNQTNKAIEQYRTAIALNPNRAEVYDSWGYALLELKHPEPLKAIVQFKNAIDHEQGLADAYNGWGNALLELKRPEEAIEQYQKAIARDVNSADAYNGWGKALQMLNQSKQASEKFLKARELGN